MRIKSRGIIHYVVYIAMLICVATIIYAPIKASDRPNMSLSETPGGKITASSQSETPTYMVSGRSLCIIFEHTQDPIRLSASYPYTYVLYNGVRCPLMYFGGTHYYEYNDNYYPVIYYRP